MKPRKMPNPGKMPSKPAKKAPPPLKKMMTDEGKRPMESDKKPKPIRVQKM